MTLILSMQKALFGDIEYAERFFLTASAELRDQLESC